MSNLYTFMQDCGKREKEEKVLNKEEQLRQVIGLAILIEDGIKSDFGKLIINYLKAVKEEANSKLTDPKIDILKNPIEAIDARSLYNTAAGLLSEFNTIVDAKKSAEDELDILLKEKNSGK
ncbi:MAG: hypothetical protein PHY56_00050 [Candidatus Omnitrophica bacterium]|nr:hypothetical protein [Candidatus Omnitrophota bacterium]